MASPQALAQVKNNEKLEDVLTRAAALLMGSHVGAHYKSMLQNQKLQVPSVSVLSRGRLRLDVALVCREQQMFQSTGPGSHFCCLSVDSSPQQGYDYLLTLQDSCLREDAAKLMCLIERASEAEHDDDPALLAYEDFLSSGFLKTTTLPVGIIGSGKSSLADKFECLFHCIKLQVGTKAGWACSGPSKFSVINQPGNPDCIGVARGRHRPSQTLRAP